MLAHQHFSSRFLLQTCIGLNCMNFLTIITLTHLVVKTTEKNILDNPHLAVWYFTQRLKTFAKYWLCKTLDTDWHWLRYEYQARRGSIHCHRTAKLKNDQGLCHLTEIALRGFLAEAKIQKLGSKLSVMKQHELAKQINEGRQASETVCQYVDWLVTSFNPQPPDTEMWVKPSVHPCKRKFSEIADSDSDYVNLLNTVLRHTKCSTSYCLKNNDSDLKCCFNYPFENCEKQHWNLKQYIPKMDWLLNVPKLKQNEMILD